MMLRNGLILAALAAVTACSGMAQRESDEQALARYMDHAGEPVESFTYLGRFDGWRALGPNKLVVWTGVNEAYLLTVQEPCRDLAFTNAIGLTTTTGTVSRGFDSVKVGRNNETCRIEQIRPVDYKAVRAAHRAGG